jgi:hypothetical protein
VRFQQSNATKLASNHPGWKPIQFLECHLSPSFRVHYFFGWQSLNLTF